MLLNIEGALHGGVGGRCLGVVNACVNSYGVCDIVCDSVDGCVSGGDKQTD